MAFGAAREALLGGEVVVRGWVRSVRAQKTRAFVDVNDGSTLGGLQLVVGEGCEGWEECAAGGSVATGASVCARGTLVAARGGDGEGVEVAVEELAVVGGADASYPLQKKRHTLEFLRGVAHLRPRTNTIGAAARVRSRLALATHEFFGGNGFAYVHTPIVTASDCEGAGEQFAVTTLVPQGGDMSAAPTTDSGALDFAEDFFGKQSFLTVSGQLNAEAYATALRDVYTFGPTFRAENSNTSRHLAEFWMIEPEMAFADLADDMACAEAYLKHCVASVLEHCAEDLEFFDKRIEKGLKDKLTKVVEAPFRRISYTEAVDTLQAAVENGHEFEFPVEWGSDLQSEHERYLSEVVCEGAPAIVYDYPAGIKAFYMRMNDDQKTVAAMDLLVPRVGELIGGSQREERLDVLEERLEAVGLDKEAYWWYLDLRRYGTVPHAGFGLGFERLVCFCTGIENIRDVIPFPRYPGSAQF
eukprot:PRCOL_00005888-RA